MAGATATQRVSKAGRAAQAATGGANKQRAPTRGAATTARSGTQAGAAIRPKLLPGMPKVAEFRSVATIWKQASDPTRLMAIWVLGNQDEAAVGDLATICGASQSSMSHHLRQLRQSKLVEPRREAKSNYYGLTEAGGELYEAIGGFFQGAG
jgi:DNA-binding transcriptional ArsR family regulator